MIEINIKIANEEKKMSKRHVIYPNDTDPIIISLHDVTLKRFVEEAVKEFDAGVDSVKMTIIMIWE